jgi:hypothetical protein
VIGREWPPPKQLEREAFELSVLSRCAVSIVSEPLPQFGLRLARQITLMPSGNRVTIRTALESIEHDTPTVSPWAAWGITKLPTPSRIAVRIDPNTDLPAGLKPLSSTPWAAMRRIGGDVLVTRAPQHAAKFGADGDLLAAEFGDRLFVQRRLPDEASDGRRLSGEAIQVNCSGRLDDAPPGSDYIEFEFIGRRAQTRPVLTVQWDLIDWNSANTDAELAALIRSL